MGDYIVHKAVDLKNLSSKVHASIGERDWVISPKYDGCHAVFCYEDGVHINTYSRTGEVVKSMPHIADALLHHYDLTGGRYAIAGEAWWPGIEFKDLSGLFRRQSGQPDLGFVPFDIVPWEYNTDTTSFPPVYLGELAHSNQFNTPYIHRLRMLADFNPHPSKVIKPKWEPVRGSPDNVMLTATAVAKFYKAQGGYDGAVLADSNGRYRVGSGSGGEFIKFKPLISESLLVTAVVADIGIKTGKNTCSLAVDFKGQVQMVSTGLKQAEVDEYVAYPERIIGKTVEVEAMGVTPAGLLREPRYKGIRTDA